MFTGTSDNGWDSGKNESFWLLFVLYGCALLEIGGGGGKIRWGSKFGARKFSISSLLKKI